MSSSPATELPLVNGRQFWTGYRISELALPLGLLLEAGTSRLAPIDRVEGMQRSLVLESLHDGDLARNAGSSSTEMVDLHDRPRAGRSRTMDTL